MRNLKSETHTAQLLISLCLLPSVPRGHYTGPIGELPLSLCPFRSLSLLAWTGPSFSSLSLFRDLFIYLFFIIIIFSFLSFICYFGPLVWCTVACYIYNTQSFFFFLIPLTVLYFTVCIYIYIFCLFTQPCLINYNVHYEFSDFCFCDFFFGCPACFPFMFLV